MVFSYIETKLTQIIQFLMRFVITFWMTFEGLRVHPIFDAFFCHHILNDAPIELHLDPCAGAAVSDYSSLSKKKIPYPLPDGLKLLHDRHEKGQEEFPLQLIPQVEEGHVCTHGNHWNCGDPVINKWIAHKGVKIYKQSITIDDSQRTVYYRPTTGECDCKLFYDGQAHLLLNLDNKHMFHYGFLFQYLHNMIEGRNPLAAYLRACNRSFAAQSLTAPVQVKLLRHAWNAFARLLEIDMKVWVLN